MKFDLNPYSAALPKVVRGKVTVDVELSDGQKAGVEFDLAKWCPFTMDIQMDLGGEPGIVQWVGPCGSFKLDGRFESHRSR